MSKKIGNVLIAFLILVTATTLLYLKPWGTKPFAKLSLEQIMSAEVFLIPPSQTIVIQVQEDIKELCGILQEITLYRKDDSGRDYNGQLVQVTLALSDGTSHTIGALGSFLFLDDVCYRTKYEPSEKLNSFGNRLRNFN